jgi:uncharacterized BrkB/YihY/UPF0761 family membrane protein
MKKGSKIVTIFNLLCVSMLILLCLFLFTPNTRIEGMVSPSSSTATNLIIVGAIGVFIGLVLFNTEKIENAIRWLMGDAPIKPVWTAPRE